MQFFTKLCLIIGMLLSATMLSTPQVAFASTGCAYVVGPNGNWYPDTTSDFSTAGDGLKKAPTGCAGEQELMGKILRFITMLSGLVIVAAVGMIIYAGLKYITGAGDPKQIESAKQQLWYSGVGLFIVLTAFTILKLFKSASGF